jgi:hypothetical protein
VGIKEESEGRRALGSGGVHWEMPLLACWIGGISPPARPKIQTLWLYIKSLQYSFFLSSYRNNDALLFLQNISTTFGPPKAVGTNRSSPKVSPNPAKPLKKSLEPVAVSICGALGHIDNFHLDGNVEGDIVWRLTLDGQYTTKSAYGVNL